MCATKQRRYVTPDSHFATLSIHVTLSPGTAGGKEGLDYVAGRGVGQGGATSSVMLLLGMQRVMLALVLLPRRRPGRRERREGDAVWILSPSHQKSCNVIFKTSISDNFHILSLTFYHRGKVFWEKVFWEGKF